MVTKRQLTDRIAQATDVSTREAAQVVDLFLAALAQELQTGDPIQLRGFGTFKVVTTAPRTVRHPATGEPLQVPARRRVRFKPSDKLNALIDDQEQ